MLLFKVIFDFEPNEFGDLNLHEGDIIEYLYQISENWYYGRNLLTNSVGSFPFNFVEKINLPENLDYHNIYIVNTSDNSKGDLIVAEEESHDRIYGYYIFKDRISEYEEEFFKSKLIKFYGSTNKLDEQYVRCVAHSKHESKISSELSFNVNDVIWMDRNVNGSLARGILKGKTGYFLLSKVNIETESADWLEHIKNDRKNRWVVLYDFDSKLLTDLQIAKGERLRYLDSVDINWLLMQNYEGKVGMVPRNFVKNISITSTPSIDYDSSMSRTTTTTPTPATTEVTTTTTTTINTYPLSSPAPSAEVLTPKLRTKALGFDDAMMKMEENNGRRDSDESHYVICTTKVLENPYDANVLEKFKTVKQRNDISLSYLDERILLLENEIELISHNIRSIKNRLIKNASLAEQSPELLLMKNNLAFLSEDHKIRIKELVMLRENREKVIKGEPVSGDDVSNDALLNSDSDKRLNHRRKTIEELIETENKFLESIEVTLKAFDKNLIDGKVSSDDYRVLFGDLDVVLLTSKNFYKSLQEATKWSLDDANIGEVFLDYITTFDVVYREYCMNYEKKIDIITKNNLNSNEAIISGLQRIELSSCGLVISLNDMLSKPFQRLFKYPLLLKSLKENTPKEHEDYVNICKAISEMENITKKCNERKRFEELKTEIFEKSDQILYKKALHGIQKVPKRLVTSMYIGSSDDRQFSDLVIRFKNMKKCIGFFVEIVFLLRYNLKEVLNLYSSMTNSLVFVGQTSFGSLSEQYLVICKNAELDFDKKYVVSLDNLVINPLTKLLSLFAGPKLLIKKRQNKYLDYCAAQQKLAASTAKETNRSLADKVNELHSQFAVIDSTLKEELPQLTKKSSQLLNECVANFLQLTTDMLSESIGTLRKLLDNEESSGEELSQLCRSQQMDMISIMTRNLVSSRFINQDRLVHQRLDPNNDGSVRGHTYIQSEEDIKYLQSKFHASDLMEVKKEFQPTKPHHVYVPPGCIVGVVKRCDPQGYATNWLVEVSSKRRGFVPRSYLSVAYKLNVTTQMKTGQVLNLEIKEPEQYDDLQSPTLSIDSNHFDLMQLSPNAISISYNEAQSKKRIQSERSSPQPQENRISPSVATKVNGARIKPEVSSTKIRKAMYDHKSRGDTEISMRRGDLIQLLRDQDSVGNREWSMVRNLATNSIGYVPTNYLSCNTS